MNRNKSIAIAVGVAVAGAAAMAGCTATAVAAPAAPDACTMSIGAATGGADFTVPVKFDNVTDAECGVIASGLAASASTESDDTTTLTVTRAPVPAGYTSQCSGVVTDGAAKGRTMEIYSSNSGGPQSLGDIASAAMCQAFQSGGDSGL